MKSSIRQQKTRRGGFPSRTWPQIPHYVPEPETQTLCDPSHLQGFRLSEPSPHFSSPTTLCSTSLRKHKWFSARNRYGWRCGRLYGSVHVRAPPGPTAQSDGRRVRTKAREPPPHEGRCWVTSGEFLDLAVLVTLYTRENRAEEGSILARPREAQGRG